MARSNTHYYNLCYGWGGPVGEDGFCDFHRPSGGWNKNGSKCIAPGEYETRRGLYRRKPRFPKWSWKTHCFGPPHSVKAMWRRRIRRIYNEEMRVRPNDPELFAAEKWLIGQYGSWS